MRIQSKLKSFICLTLLIYSIDCKGYFTVIAPKYVTQDKSYRISVTAQGYDAPKDIELSIVNIQDSSEEEPLHDVKLTFENDSTKTVTFDLKTVTETTYFVEIKTMEGEERKIYKQQLSFQRDGGKKSQKIVLIQTDKSIYKPSDKIQFRVLLLDGDTKPLTIKSEKVQVQITDGAKNRVKQFDDVKLIKGVYQNELQLSDMPIMGNWSIHVNFDDKELKTKDFEVAEYTLPKFEVIIDSNPHVAFKEGKIKATVKAKYTFGKIAKGKAKISAKATYYKVVKSVEVDGKTSVEFDFKDEFELSGVSDELPVTITAKFKEELSGRVENATKIVKIHRTPHYIDLKTSSTKFKPSLPVTVNAFVRYHDKDAPVEDKHNAVKFTLKYFFGSDVNSPSYKDPENEIKEVAISNGVATLCLSSLSSDIRKFSVKAEYLGTSKEISEIKRIHSKSYKFLQIRALNEKPTLSEKVIIDVNATDEMRVLTYHVMNYDKIFVSKTVEVPNTKNFSFEFMPKPQMAPKTIVYVYYIASDGEFIHDSLTLNFEVELENHQLNVELSRNQTKPDTQIDILVSSKPNSFVGLLGVDQSVLVLKKGNDIEKSDVMEEISKQQKKYFPDIPSKESKNWNHRLSDIFIITNVNDAYQPKKYGWNNVGGYRPSSSYGWASPSYSRPSYRPPSSKPSFKPPSYSMLDLNYEKEITNDIQSIIPQREIKIRKTFPETWIFDSINFDSDTESKTITKKVPETITSWIITGFSIDPITGLAFTKQPSRLNVFQPFFVSTNLPYSIKRGEVVSIPIIVFNYLSTDQETEVTLYNEDKEFEFTEVKNDEIRHKRSLDSQRKKNVVIKSQEGVSLSFMIRPLKAGHIKIKVTANSLLAGDGIERQLIVVPEGVTQYKNKALLIDLRNSSEYKTNEVISIPSEAVPDSTRIEFSVIGDILGPSIENLDKLIKLPYGCGEQNMLNFVPNIVVLDYLTSINKLSSDIEKKAKKYMETGYQRELTYKHNDGSYSAFGGSDKKGSTWLTAFVAKSFYHASKYITVDDDIIKQALEFLKTNQNSDGSFPEVGYVSHKAMQGGASKGIALTSYSLITFLENDKMSKSYQSTIDKALNYIVNNTDSLHDDYSLAIASYALLLAKHDVGYSLLSKLEQNAKTLEGLTYWQKREEPKKTVSWYSRPNSIDVEMSAYGLQAFVEGGKKTEAVPIMKWLVKQRNKNGGFQSTQDTVVGIRALSKLAATFHSSKFNIENTVKYDGGEAILSVNDKNVFVLQKHELASNARNFEITARGSGVNILQLSYKYNMNDGEAAPSFTLIAQVEDVSNKGFLQLKVCTKYITNRPSKKSNMAIMEVTLPSGFTFDTDSSPELLSLESVKKVETKESDTMVVVYFNDLSTDEVCPTFKAYRTHSVAKQKPAPIVVYDYYENSRRATTFYNAPEISLCDICNDAEECKHDCETMEINSV